MSALALIVDDEPGILETLSGVIADQGHRTLTTSSGVEAVRLYAERRPDVVFLDVWLPDQDGLETLAALRALDPEATVVLMSGHGTTSTAVKAIKMGAFDYLEKPLSYAQAVETMAAALAHRATRSSAAHEALLAADGSPSNGVARSFSPPPAPPFVREVDTPQRTIGHSTVIYGLGLHSGGRTGMVLQPLPPGSGIHFVSLPTSSAIPAYVGSVGDTEYATTLVDRTGGLATIKTVEHLLSALHAYGVTNLLIKVHGEIPVLDGSAVDFCRTLEQIGLVDQPAPRREAIIDRVYEVGDGKNKLLRIEPSDAFEVSYLLRYPPPIGEQSFEFRLDSADAYRDTIAPARTFGFMRDLKMMNELGLGSGGRLDNFILVGADNVLNTELRFPDEFVRHKILDVIGDLYLLGYPIRGKVTARLTGHRDNIAILRALISGGAATSARTS
jgi:UDP-3-O-[3-hydroxymyristoyl] N-acetylglucosamine deacetylase